MKEAGVQETVQSHLRKLALPTQKIWGVGPLGPHLNTTSASSLRKWVIRYYSFLLSRFTESSRGPPTNLLPSFHIQTKPENQLVLQDGQPFSDGKKKVPIFYELPTMVSQGALDSIITRAPEASL